VSDRHGQENWSYTASSGGQDGTAIQDGGALSTGSTGDFAGWQGVRISNIGGRRTVCGTAKNWSHDQSTNQAFRVVYDR
jgi:hypothetical protein